jgi:hypothetical protein
MGYLLGLYPAVDYFFLPQAPDTDVLGCYGFLVSLT